jgi:plasmid replication initiation protein
MKKQSSIPGTLVKKDNALIRTKINVLNIDGSRILANLIACIRSDDPQFKKTYSVAVKDFITDPSGRAYTRVKEVCRDLGGATAELEELINGKKEFRVRPFFTDIRYYNGYVFAEFNPRMRDVLLNLKECFTQYHLIDYMSLPSVYSQRIFEILKSWQKIPQGHVDIELSELHKILNTPVTFQNDFAQFRRKVLEKAHKDITKKTDLTFDWEPIKNGRAVESIRFYFDGKRVAIAEKSHEQKKAERQRKLETQRFIKAVNCAKNKKGICDNQDNVGIVCRLCLKNRLCEEIRKREK